MHTILKTGFDLIGQNLKEASRALFGSLMGVPEQSLGAADLVDKCEGGVAAAPLDLVHADCLDPGEITMGDAPQNGVVHSLKHVFPCRLEGDSSLFPRQPLRLSSEEPAVRRRQMLLALGPRHAIYGHAALRAIDPPQGVDEEHRDGPQRDELEPSGREPIVAGTLLAAARTDSPAIGPGVRSQPRCRAPRRLS